MKICLIGDFSENLDEGYKNTSHYLARELEKRYPLSRLDIKQLGKIGFWSKVITARPHIVHTIAQPTLKSLIFTRLIKQVWPPTKTLVSALRPEDLFKNGELPMNTKVLIQLTKPDLMLVQSKKSETKFKSLGCMVANLSNGVNLERFRPVGEKKKFELRQKYGIHPTQPVVLHVGHFTPERNLISLAELSRNDIQVVIAGSHCNGAHSDLIKQLENFGFILFKGYQPQIEELYMLSDCYVFPVSPGDSLSMPLSVLEAMACNLPIVTTRFEGLENFNHEDAGFTFFDQPEELHNGLQEVLQSHESPKTRDMVQGYSWQAVTSKLSSYYNDLITE